MKTQYSTNTSLSSLLILIVVLGVLTLLITACYKAQPAQPTAQPAGDEQEEKEPVLLGQGETEQEETNETPEEELDEPEEPAVKASISVVELIEVEEIPDEETPTSRLLRNATELKKQTKNTTTDPAAIDQPFFEPAERFPGIKGNASGSSLINISKDFFDRIQTVTVVEGEPIKLKPIGRDPDNDPIIYTFTKPFDPNGRWQTKLGDEGTYTIQITASDGELTITKPIKVKVLHRNRPPFITAMEPLFVDEGKALRIAPVVTDPEKDNLTITYSGWMQRATKEIGYTDAGQYQVTITAFDGQLNSTLSVPIIVNNVNRAPDFYVVVE